jgi:hypothetical protein
MDDPPDLIPFNRDAPGAPARGDPMRPRPPAGPGPDDAPTISLGLAILRAWLDAELAGLDQLGDLALDAVAALDAIRAEIGRAPRGMRGNFDARLAGANDDLRRIGRAGLDLEAAIRATRAEIKRAEKRR